MILRFFGLGKKVPREKKKDAFALFNLDISIPPTVPSQIVPLDLLDNEREHAERTLGPMTVFSDGIILPRQENSNGLHTYNVNLLFEDELPSPYIQHKNGSIEKLERLDHVAYMHSDVWVKYSLSKPMEPHYTLEGFYGTNNLDILDKNILDEKCGALTHFLEKRNEHLSEGDRFRMGSSDRDVLKRVREMEIYYRRRVSDQ